MAIQSHALTTVARVKARLNISDSSWDALLAELINGATDYMEAECGGRRFKSTAYTQEVYSKERDQKIVYLKNYPITAISAAQYRPGTPSSPSWTDFLTDDYETVEDGKRGAVAVYSSVNGNNCIRFSYTAGYVIDFSTVANHLPYELSDLCERLTVKAFKKRESEGKTSEAFQEVSMSWASEMSADDRRILERYARMIFA